MTTLEEYANAPEIAAADEAGAIEEHPATVQNVDWVDRPQFVTDSTGRIREVRLQYNARANRIQIDLYRGSVTASSVAGSHTVPILDDDADAALSDIADEIVALHAPGCLE